MRRMYTLEFHLTMLFVAKLAYFLQSDERLNLAIDRYNRRNRYQRNRNRGEIATLQGLLRFIQGNPTIGHHGRRRRGQA